MAKKQNEKCTFDISDFSKVGEIIEAIVNRYKKFGVEFEVVDQWFQNGILTVKIELCGKTQIRNLKKFKEEVQISAKLRELNVVRKGKSLYIIAIKKKPRLNTDLMTCIKDPEYSTVVKNLKLAHPIGVDDQGNRVIQDLTLYPHLLISGTTNSGKSIAVISLIISLLAKYHPNRINLLLCDPSGDLLVFNGIPHLTCPVITDFAQFYHALKALHKEMLRRIKLKRTDDYDKLPYIIFVVDEFISLISGDDRDKKSARILIGEILRQGRHARIHAVLVAFNPTKQNLKLDISDLPAKMVFRVSRLCNSVSVLGEGGAEKLNGNGEMLFQSSQGEELKKLQGFYISPEELETSLEIVKSYWQKNEYDNSVIFHIAEEEVSDIPQLLPVHSSAHANDQKLFAQVMVWAMQQSLVSCNQLRQKYNTGWDKAKNLMIKLEEFGVISELESKLPRKVLLNSLSEIPKETMEFLSNNGYSEEDISNILRIKVQGEQENKI